MYNCAPLVKGKRVTGFTNGEEEPVHLTKVVPCLVEDELKRIGGLYGKAKDWESHAVVDRPSRYRTESRSSTAAAQSLMKLLVRGSSTDFQSKRYRIQSSFRTGIG
jgi:putative intracellular protease/amidase